jgi:hypothetical protein
MPVCLDTLFVAVGAGLASARSGLASALSSSSLGAFSPCQNLRRVKVGAGWQLGKNSTFCSPMVSRSF